MHLAGTTRPPALGLACGTACGTVQQSPVPPTSGQREAQSSRYAVLLQGDPYVSTQMSNRRGPTLPGPDHLGQETRGESRWSVPSNNRPCAKSIGGCCRCACWSIFSATSTESTSASPR